jgi:hypothetical protein
MTIDTMPIMAAMAGAAGPVAPVESPLVLTGADWRSTPPGARDRAERALEAAEAYRRRAAPPPSH